MPGTMRRSHCINGKIPCGTNGIRACKRLSWQRNSRAGHSREVGHRIPSGGRTGAAFIPRPWPPSAWKFTTGSSRFTEAEPRAKRIKPRKRRDSALMPLFHSRRFSPGVFPKCSRSGEISCEGLSNRTFLPPSLPPSHGRENQSRLTRPLGRVKYRVVRG